jgi:hypothetical protein
MPPEIHVNFLQRGKKRSKNQSQKKEKEKRKETTKHQYAFKLVCY